MSTVFSKIIDGELPGHFVWRDDHCVAIMTIQPFRPGHVLVIPIAEVDHWDDLEDELASHLMLVAKKIGRAIKASFPCERVGMMIVGLEVPHTHIHLMPISQVTDMNFAHAEMASAENLAEAASIIKAAL